MSKLRLIAMILGVILLAIPSVARAQATPTKIKLLTQNTGWALMRGRLFWTTDFGQDWRDITPPLATSPSPHGAESIVNVFFLDTRSGWALLRRAWGKYNDWSFDLASTDDSGITWSILPVDLPNWLQWEELSGGGAIDFVDSAHGWMNLSLASSTNFARGLLYSTADGGRTWRSVSKAPMIAAEVRFTTLDDGWLAGGPAGQDLYSTHDGGKGWKRVNLAAPSEFGQVGLPTYWPPIFTDPKHGSVIVSYERGGFVAFSTSDGGRMWKTIAALSGISPTRAWASVVDSSLVVGRILKGSSLVLIQAGPHEQTRRAVAAIQPGQGTVRHLSFRGNQVGWALANGRLYSTTNAGESWKDVTPKLQPSRAHTMNAATSRAHTAQQASPVDLRTATGAAGPSGKGVGSIHTSAHLGFDSCTAPATGDMGAWWTTSPYYDVGFYLGGSNTHCSLGSQYPPPGSPDPTPAQWVSIVANQGWGVVPIWVGPQAPYNTCTTGYATYVDTDPATAQTQGEDEADAAVSAASGLGLTTGSIIYYDMELYDQANSTCQGAVADFLMGWDYELHSQGYKAGVYTNSAPAQADWNGLYILAAEYQPDDIWVARYNSAATIWGLDHKLSNGLTDSTWAEGYRGHQYLNYDTSGAGEVYGGVPSLAQAIASTAISSTRRWTEEAASKRTATARPALRTTRTSASGHSRESTTGVWVNPTPARGRWLAG